MDIAELTMDAARAVLGDKWPSPEDTWALQLHRFKLGRKPVTGASCGSWLQHFERLPAACPPACGASAPVRVLRVSYDL